MSESKLGLPIVCIGASAGGVEACKRLLGKLPSNTGLGYVVVIHLNPDQESRLAEVLAATASMPVTQAHEAMAVEADRVYIIPPDAEMVLKGSRLRLTPRDRGAHPHLPIDAFMESLAKENGPRAVGVLLSGTGRDGTRGLAAVKAEDGITLVQDPATAQHRGMAQSAIEEGVADFIASPEALAEEIAHVAGHTYFTSPESGQGKEEEYQHILALLRGLFRVDFKPYRDSTLKRRILRRMALTKHDTLPGYAAYLRDNRAETDALYRDMLINVTCFFRDPEVFESLKEQVFPRLVQDRKREDTIRFWVAGCSTGQEAYSLAIVLSEYLAERPEAPAYQIFASDVIESGSLDKARGGLYTEGIEADVTPERLKRFFTREERGYRISKDIRARCIFAKHDLTGDPPFSRVDLVTCRNVLIYMNPQLQRRVLPIFHYALLPERFLLLGPSETIGRDSDLFEAVDREKKLYVRKSATPRLPSFEHKPPFGHHFPERTGETSRNPPPPVSHVDFQREADRILLGRYAPSGVLVNANLDILQFRGRTRPFLEPPQGEAAFTLLKMANEGLFAEANSAVQEAQARHRVVRRENVHVRDEGGLKVVNLEVFPVALPTSSEMCFLILFDEASPPGVSEQASRPVKAQEAEESLAQLREENASLRDYLQLAREQHEAAIEELKASNEELLSSNEELQSTNEELETAKEEYQSANEELTTLNEEMGLRNQEMARLNNDLGNLLATMSVPTIMADAAGRIRLLTPAAERALRLSAADRGRHLGEIKLEWKGPDVERAVSEVIAKGMTFLHEVQDRNGRWHTLQVHPYRTAEGRVEGAVLILIDIDGLKQAHERLRESEAHARAIVNTIREPLLTLREDLVIETANASFYETFRLTPQDVEGKPIEKLGGVRWDIPNLRNLLLKAMAREGAFEEFEMAHDFPGLGKRLLRLNARRLALEQGKPPRVLLAIEDITAQRKAEALLKDQSRMLEQAVQDRTAELQESTNQMEAFSFSVSHDLRAPLRAVQGYAEALLEEHGRSLDGSAREYLDKIIRSGIRMDRLIQDILTFSRSALGEMEVREVDTGRLLREILQELPELQPGKADVLIEDPLAPVMAHESSLGQCLSNLLMNAAKFVPPGRRPVIRVRTERIGSLTRIWVEDNGIGIAPEHHRRIFAMFEKLNANEAYAGTGIGLAIVKKSAERMGGMAGVESALGAGSRFWIQLPGPA